MNTWRIREPGAGDRLRDARHTMWFGVCVSVGLGLVWVMALVPVAVLVPDLGGVGVAAVAGGLLVGTACTVVGAVVSAKAFPRARPYEDRVWFDDADLWWVRHRPRVPGGEPARVARCDIVEVGLSAGDRAVVLSTADGTEHTVTDLGTPTGSRWSPLGERVAPASARRRR